MILLQWLKNLRIFWIRTERRTKLRKEKNKDKEDIVIANSGSLSLEPGQGEVAAKDDAVDDDAPGDDDAPDDAPGDDDAPDGMNKDTFVGVLEMLRNLNLSALGLETELKELHIPDFEKVMLKAMLGLESATKEVDSWAGASSGQGEVVLQYDPSKMIGIGKLEPMKPTTGGFEDAFYFMASMLQKTPVGMQTTVMKALDIPESVKEELLNVIKAAAREFDPLAGASSSSCGGPGVVNIAGEDQITTTGPGSSGGPWVVNIVGEDQITTAGSGPSVEVGPDKLLLDTSFQIWIDRADRGRYLIQGESGPFKSKVTCLCISEPNNARRICICDKKHKRVVDGISVTSDNGKTYVVVDGHLTCLSDYFRRIAQDFKMDGNGHHHTNLEKKKWWKRIAPEFRLIFRTLIRGLMFFFGKNEFLGVDGSFFVAPNGKGKIKGKVMPMLLDNGIVKGKLNDIMNLRRAMVDIITLPFGSTDFSAEDYGLPEMLRIFISVLMRRNWR